LEGGVSKLQFHQVEQQVAFLSFFKKSTTIDNLKQTKMKKKNFKMNFNNWRHPFCLFVCLFLCCFFKSFSQI